MRPGDSCTIARTRPSLRERRLLLAWFRELRRREQMSSRPSPALPFDWPDLQKLRGRARMRRFGSLPDRDQLRIKRRADALAERRRKANGLDHLKRE